MRQPDADIPERRTDHVHTWRCLASWSVCPGLLYSDWLRVAHEHPEQDRVWRDHERNARINYTDQRDYDIGGEA